MKKWKDKTKGGHPVEIWKEADGWIYGRSVMVGPINPKPWMVRMWSTHGEDWAGDSSYDLVEKVPERIVIESLQWPTFDQPIPTNFYFQTAALNGKRGRLIFEVEDEP